MSDGPLLPYQGFEGQIATTVAASQPWWPPRPTAPAGAPNVVIVLCDDLGFSDIGCFGGEIETPHLDRLASESLRLTNFHVAPMCSPTRAALLTGLNHHLAGVATVAHVDEPWIMGYDLYPMDTLMYKKRFLREAIAGEYVIFFEHDPGIAAGIIRERQGRKTVEPVQA